MLGGEQREHGAYRPTEQPDERDADHQQSGFDDDVAVVFGNADIDHALHKTRLDQVHRDFERHEQRRENRPFPVRLEKCQQASERAHRSGVLSGASRDFGGEQPLEGWNRLADELLVVSRKLVEALLEGFPPKAALGMKSLAARFGGAEPDDALVTGIAPLRHKALLPEPPRHRRYRWW